MTRTTEQLLPPIGDSSATSHLLTPTYTLAYTQALIARMVALTLAPHWRTLYRNTILHKILVPLPEFEQLFACKSGGARSWKVQEGRKGTPIQLV